MDTLARYQKNLAALVIALQQEHTEKIGEPLSIRKLAEKVNSAIAPALGEVDLAYQSFQNWQKQKYKNRMEPKSSQALGVFLGLPASSAAKSLELFLNEFEGDITPPVGACVGQFLRQRPAAIQEAAGTYGVPTVSIEKSDLAQLQRHQERLALEQAAIARRLKELLNQTAPSLDSIIWSVLKQAPAGKFRANLANNEAVACEFARKAANFDVSKMEKILAGEIVDLSSDEIEDVELGLCRVSGDNSWNDGRLSKVLRHGWD